MDFGQPGEKSIYENRPQPLPPRRWTWRGCGESGKTSKASAPKSIKRLIEPVPLAVKLHMTNHTLACEAKQIRFRSCSSVTRSADPFYLSGDSGSASA